MTGSALSPGSGGSQATASHLLFLQKLLLLWDLERASGRARKGDTDQNLRTKTAQGLGGEQEGHAEAEQRCLHRSLDRDEEASLGRAGL